MDDLTVLVWCSSSTGQDYSANWDGEAYLNRDDDDDDDDDDDYDEQLHKGLALLGIYFLKDYYNFCRSIMK